MLRHRARADKQVLRHALNHRGECLGHHQPAESPARHIEILGKTVDADDAPAQFPGHGQSRLAKALFVAQAQVNLVHERDAAAAVHQAVQALQFVGCHRGAGWIRRRGQQHAACLRDPGGIHFVCGELKAFSRRGRYQGGATFCSTHKMPVAGIARVRHQDLVVRFDQGQASQVECSRGTGRDDDAAGRDIDAEATGVPIADFFAQRRQAGGLRVLCVALRDGARCSFLHQGWCAEVRLADIQKNHRPAAAGKLRCQRGGGLGHFHDIKGLNLFGALCNPHVSAP